MPQMQDEHARRMRALIDAAAAWTGDGLPRAAAVYNACGELIATEADSSPTLCDVTGHAELNAIRAACQTLKTASLSGGALYSISEPCAMCISACLIASVNIVVFGALREDLAPVVAPTSDILSRDLVAHSRSNDTRLLEGVEREACVKLLFRRK